METVNYKCPACNGPLHFVGSSGKLQCDYCESSFTAEEVEAYYAAKQAKADDKAEKAEETGASEQGAPRDVNATAEEKANAAQDPIAEYLKRSNWEGEGVDNLVAYSCSSCGAELMVDKTTAVSGCPYCGNPTVLPGQLSGMLKPDYVIPFKLGKEDAIAKLNEYYKGKKFLPKAFKESNHIEEVQGVYVPFWLYDALAKGEATFNARNITTWSDSEYQYTKTDHYVVERAGHMDFKRVPADGSLKMPDAHMDAIEPFDYSEMKPFSVGYLPGYLTDRYDVSMEECSERVAKRMRSSVTQQLESTVIGYMETDVASSEASVDYEQVSYALLPVWMLHTTWNGEDFLFAMNGQTGKLIGDLPVQKSKVVAWFAGIFIPVAAVVTIIASFVF